MTESAEQKKKVGIVVQRCHESIVGGSETLAWQYATLLKDSYDVEVLSTTAIDTAYWSNVLPEGQETREGINVRRFHVDVGYSPFRTELFLRMLQDFNHFQIALARLNGQKKHIPWPIGLQSELIRRIGPHSSALVEYLREHWSEYRAIIVVTYLYPTAYFSLTNIPKGRALFAPTLHDEPPAYLAVYQQAARRAHSMIWLTEAEQRLGTALWGPLPGRVVAMAIDVEERAPAQLPAPYVLYCGRVDPNKGCATLFEYFVRFKAENPGPLRLVLTGMDDMPIPDHPDIEFRAMVPAEEKFSLMAGARAYLMPSDRESFSIVTLEAMAQRTPVLANGRSEVLADHIDQSDGGLVYNDYESFAGGLTQILSSETYQELLGTRGRNYVVAKYVTELVRQRLVDAVESCPLPETAPVFGKGASSRSVAELSEELREELSPEDLTKSPPLPLPKGWSEHQLRKLVSSVRVEDGAPDELRAYVGADFRRFVFTLGLVPEKTGQTILELGANPYFTTTLLQKFRNAKLSLANFFDGREPAGRQRVTIEQTGEVIEYEYKQFNIEADRFPYEDDSFDTVLFCEILEHLLSDPVHALLEIRRVLKPGGTLVLTTPNVARLENVRKVIAGANFYDPYSGHGPYGRHNREYTQEDLFNLLSSNGFSVRSIFTADVHPEYVDWNVSLKSITPLVKNRPTDLGQYIFCQCSVNRESKLAPPVRSSRLYRSLNNAG